MCTVSQSADATRVPGLYVVATPIGNLADFAPRARGLLEAATIVAAEDTRTARKLPGASASTARFLSLTEHNVDQRTPSLLSAAQDGTVVLVSEAGTPGIADPGARLVRAAHDAGVAVFSVPGPSALAAALAASGFETPWSLFLGFLPRKAVERRAALERAELAARVIVFFESPGRLGSALRAVAEVFGDARVVVCREVSKLHEEVVAGSAPELAARFEEARGECTVVVEVPRGEGGVADRRAALDWLAAMKRAGAQRSIAAAEVARRSSEPRDELYRAWDTI